MKAVTKVFLAATGVVVLGLTAVGCPKSPVGRMQLDGAMPLDEHSILDSAAEKIERVDSAQADGQAGFGLCEPCISDKTCARGRCVAMTTGNFCLAECAKESCPAGYECGEVALGSFCLPQLETCTCELYQEGEQRACAKESEFGLCMGLATCSLAEGWLCDASMPAEEICDYTDNNCNSEVDEGFMLGDWYFGPDNCGDCGIVCDEEIDHGLGFCSIAPPPPQCKVASCDPGYYSSDGLICELLMGAACIECQDDDDCFGGRCLLVDGLSFCLPECSGQCPGGYTCVEGDEGSFCWPDTESCECSEQTAGQLQRTCMNANEFGSCVGFQVCQAEGWGLCDAAIPAAEECNGADDNCNGVADEELSGVEPCVNSVPGVGSCPGFLICEGALGYTCNAPQPLPEVCDYLDNNCDGKPDEGFVDPLTGVYFQDQHCGSCTNDCTLLTAFQAFYQCQVNGGKADCAMVCQPGWVDLDKLPESGCECQFLSADDPPDGIDQNCDGIDGDPNNAIFVHPDGSDLNPGTPTEPVRTVSMGLQRAAEKGKGHVYVAKGYYKEQVSLRDGIQLFGGFPLDFSKREVAANPTIIEPPQALPVQMPQATVLAIEVGGKKSSLEGFQLSGPQVSLNGRSSYAIYLRDCGALLTIRENQVQAGTGGPGKNGEDGPDGHDGEPACRGCRPSIPEPPGAPIPRTTEGPGGR